MLTNEQVLDNQPQRAMTHKDASRMPTSVTWNTVYLHASSMGIFAIVSQARSKTNGHSHTHQGLAAGSRIQKSYTPPQMMPRARTNTKTPCSAISRTDLLCENITTPHTWWCIWDVADHSCRSRTGVPTDLPPAMVCLPTDIFPTRPAGRRWMMPIKVRSQSQSHLNLSPWLWCWNERF